MRLYESTSTITQNEAATLQRYAHHVIGKITMRWMLAIYAGMGLLVFYACSREDIQAAIPAVAVVAAAALLTCFLFRISFKAVVAQAHPWGDRSWAHTTWFDEAGVHRLDDDGDEFVYPLKKLRFAYRVDCTVLLCTMSQAVIPVNLLYLSDEERQSFFDLLKRECPKLVALE